MVNVCIMAVPTASDPVHEIGPEEKHATLLYFGDVEEHADPERMGTSKGLLTAALAQAAAETEPFAASVTGIEPLGNDDPPALVWLLDSPDLQALFKQIPDVEAEVASLYEGAAATRYPEYKPHVTIGYDVPMSGDAVESIASVETITFDRLALWWGDERIEFTLGENMAENEEIDDVAPVPWYGVLAPEGVKSGDGRMFGEESLRMRSLPLPLTWQKVSDDGHKGSVTVAKIEKVWRQDGMVWGSGHALQTPEADEWVSLVAEFGRYGVSIDADDLDQFSVEEMEDGTTAFLDARVCSASTVSIPAFAQAFVSLGEFSEEIAANLPAPSNEIPNSPDVECEERDADGNCIEPEAEFRDVSTEERKRLADKGAAMPDGSYPIANCEDLKNAIQAIGRAKDPAATKAHIRKRKKALGCPDVELPESWAIEDTFLAAAMEEFADVAPGRTEDGPGWLTHPVDTDRLRDYWVRGAGAAKINWGVPGDFNRCRVNLAEYVKPQYLSGYCANRHFDALGYWPGQAPHAGGVMTASAATEVEVGEAQETGALLASAPRTGLPKAWFSDPGLEGPTALTITDDGQVYGHLATWGLCHIGIGDDCVEAPHSATGYAFFRTGQVVTDDGPVAVGNVTMGGGHAADRLGWRPAIDHYDSTSTVIADVAVGEDEHGIWVAGALREGVEPERAAELRASGGLSGDWREVRRGSGELELVAALAVNVGGFPVPRVRLAASAGQPTSLVAAGALIADAEEAPEVDAVALGIQVYRTIKAQEGRDALSAKIRTAGLASLRDVVKGE